MRNPVLFAVLLFMLVASGLAVSPLLAQQPSAYLPDAPQLHAQAQPPAPPSTPSPNPTASGPSAPSGPPLTRQQAEQLALKNNPRTSVAALLALAQKQAVRVTRSTELPTFNGELTAVDAVEATRISTGSLGAARLLYHVGAGVELNQLITDFGHTRNLIASSSLQAQASGQYAQATREDVVLAADLAFYRALEAQATLQVAQSTVNARQAVSDQVGALTASKLKSTLDQSFAQVNLSQAQLLNLDAQSQFDAAIASLNEVLGATDDTAYSLIDDPAPPAPVAPSPDAIIALALQQRPDLLAQKLAHDADLRFARAQHDQILPTVSGLGVVGVTPVGEAQYFTDNWYGAAGVNIAVPIFNGFKYRAEAKEADLRAKASDEQSRVLIDRIVRDVRTAWLAMTTAQQRMIVTAQLVQESNTALDLAGTRYRLGLSSIVELSQAQLQQTQAQIDDANARFEYEADLAALRFQSGSQP
jgi:outer membrane protein